MQDDHGCANTPPQEAFATLSRFLLYLSVSGSGWSRQSEVQIGQGRSADKATIAFVYLYRTPRDYRQLCQAMAHRRPA
jgi:hypothetical protein